DGRVDEGFDLHADPSHCGRCGRVCAYAFGVPACQEGLCQLQACEAGHHDVDRDPANGCEYACQPAGAEACNGRDDDCDGRLDEAFDVRADPLNCGGCGVVCAYRNGLPLCVAGQCRLDGCQGDFVDADGDPANGCECAPAGPEVCDGADQDCDGRVDEGFDLSGDPAHCGRCGNACGFANAEALCSQGQCRMGDCQGAFLDADRDARNGCECQPAAEACDGADNDCDGRVDEDFDTDFDGENCGACGQSCLRDNAWTRCDLGMCRLRFCDDGFVDADGSLDNGCEVNCAEQPDVPACGAPIAYPGTYDADPQMVYTCFDFLGDEALSFDVRGFSFSVAGGQLDVLGAPALMSQRPAPVGPDFEVRGALPGGDFGCTETYILRGTFEDADTWRGVFEVRFAGLACDFTDCSNQSWQVAGVREP
ncbi:MAG: hypothetical protein KC613_20900, partial [Myxococcales bacterium]|nr:hypothetical protein [Myxococcales bacterium]